jgi:hypothetical protein
MSSCDVESIYPSVPTTLTSLRRGGTEAAKVEKLRANALAALVAKLAFLSSRSRMDLIRSPVLMPTGHFTWR